jgi:hypothetical protein
MDRHERLKDILLSNLFWNQMRIMSGRSTANFEGYDGQVIGAGLS